MNDLKPAPETDTDAPDCWPPLAHLRVGRLPPKPGERALCGAKLMGIDLEGSAGAKVCVKCLEIARSLRRHL